MTQALLPSLYSLPTVRVQLVRECPEGEYGVTSIDRAKDLLIEAMRDYDREVFAVLLLDTKHRVLGFNVCNVGGLNSCPVEPRQVLTAALLANARSIIVTHNHPSGDTEPSQADIHLTKKIKEAADLLSVDLLDHIIVGSNGRARSLKEAGYL